jgi:17beta-estradiol 17-dehydrogenase / very-long-chain 3-oxoacyl-CoA reductase
VVAIDVSKPEARETGFAQIESLAKTLDIGILGMSATSSSAASAHFPVNNVGASHEMPVPFADTPTAEIENIVQTNILGTLYLTRAVLPSMIARSAGSGPQSLVLNMGSLTGRIPSSLLATYSMSKGGLATWTKALAEEVSNFRVVVQMVQPAFVVRLDPSFSPTKLTR